MSIDKTTGAEIYNVRNAGEWATLVVRCWADPPRASHSGHRGQLLIQSTFGSWSYYWNAPGIPFKRFLAGVSFDYAMEKLLGRSLEEHDGHATLAGLLRRLLRMRRQRRIDEGVARYLWREIDGRHEALCGSAESFWRACGEIQHDAGQSWALRNTHGALREIAELLEEPWNHTETRTSPQAVGFWRDIWPEFAQTMRAEAAAEAVPA